MLRDYIPDEKMQSFERFRDESQKGIEIKEEEEENKNTSTAASITEEEDIRSNRRY